MSDEFVKNICRTVGHEWKLNKETFQDECDRCKLTLPWNAKWTSKLAQAMAAPLKTTLDYQSIGREFFEPSEVIKPADLPIYDKDLPNQEPQA